MQSRVANVALGCLKLGGAGSLLSLPLGSVSLAAGEATFAGSLATMLVAGAVTRAADGRDMARLTSAASRVARVKVPGRQATAETMVVNLGGGVMLHMGSPATLNGSSPHRNGNSPHNEVN
jgi:hypothetical protein